MHQNQPPSEGKQNHKVADFLRHTLEFIIGGEATKHATPWNSLSPAERQQRVADSNNRVRKVWITVCSSGTTIFWLITCIYGKVPMSFMEMFLGGFVLIATCGFGMPLFMVWGSECTNCGVFMWDARGNKVFKRVETELIQESEYWIQGTRQDAIRDVSGKITGYIDRPEKQKRVKQTVDHVYHCQMCESTWRIRQEYES